MSELMQALYVTLYILGILGGLKELLSRFIVKIENNGKLDERTGCFLVRPGLYFFEGMGLILKYAVVWGVITLILIYAK